MADPSPLSERELDIMQRVATGASNREIARALEISPNTVKVHLRNIFDKLGVASRTEATLVALREGWVNVEGVAPVEDNGAGGSEAQGVTTSVGTLELEPDQLENRVLYSEEIRDDFHRDGSQGEVTSVRSDQFQTEGRTTQHEVVVPEVDGPVQPSARFPAWLTVGLGIVALVSLVLLVAVLVRPDPSLSSVNPNSVAEVERWRELARLPVARSDAAVVTVGGNLIVLGGMSGEGVESDVVQYDPSLDQWEPLSDLPRSVSSAPAIFYGGQILVVGGLNAEGEAVTTVQSYDTVTGVWKELAPLPTPLAHSALAAFEGDLFVFGGTDGSTTTDSIYRYQAEMNEWELVGALPSARADVAAAGVADGIVLAGGVYGDGTPLSEVLHFDPRASVRIRPEAPLPAPEAAPQMVALGNALYLVGDGTLYERDPQRQWQAIPLSDADIPVRAALAVSDPYIYVIGGESENGPSDAIWRYQAIFRSFIPMVPNDSGQGTP